MDDQDAEYQWIPVEGIMHIQWNENPWASLGTIEDGSRIRLNSNAVGMAEVVISLDPNLRVFQRVKRLPDAKENEDAR